MNERIVTYHSVNADADKAWVAYVDLGADYLGIRFSAATEPEVLAKANVFWSEKEAEREAARASREAARVKAAETRSRKQMADA